MSFKTFLTELTKNKKTVSAQVALKSGANLVCPRRVNLDDDPEVGAVGYEAAFDDLKHEEPTIFVGMVLMPDPKTGQTHLAKAFFDPQDVAVIIFIPEDALPKIGHDRPVPRGGRTAEGLYIP